MMTALLPAKLIKVLFPFYYRNAELIIHAVGVDPTQVSRRCRKRVRVFFHGDSIT